MAALRRALPSSPSILSSLSPSARCYASSSRPRAIPATAAAGAGSSTARPLAVQKRPISLVAVASGAVVVSSLAYVLGALYPPDLAHLVSPRSAPAPPSSDSKEGKAFTARTETELQSLDAVKEMRARTQAGEDWYECRPYSGLAPERLTHSLTAGVLRGPGKLTVPPLVFARDDESEAVVVGHLGRSLCGHEGIVHGGMVATVLDEATGRNAILNLPSKIGVTANLTINYRAPTRADQFVIIKTRLTEKKGRKVVVFAEMSSITGQVLADATAIYVEPKWAAYLADSGVSELLGQKAPVGALPKPPPKEALP